jgi:hypothetical protein
MGMSDREVYEQWRAPYDPWANSFQGWDSRKDLLRSFMEFKAHQGAVPPRNGIEMFDLLCEFDAVMNRYAIEQDKVFKEHMATCNRPIMLTLAAALTPRQRERKS